MTELEQFEAALRVVEPAARLVPERHLRKLVHYLCDHGRTIPRNPNRPLWASREELAAADVIPRSAFHGTEDPLLVLTTPDDRSLDTLPASDQLREYWRLLFEAALTAKLGRVHEGTCEARLAKLGPAAVREIRFVLEAEHLADPEADDAAVYRTFAAAYLVLHAFSPDSLGDFFPSLPPAEAVRELLRSDVEAETLLARTRLAGAADAVRPPDGAAKPAALKKLEPRAADARRARALDAERKGNFVRAAILRTQAGHLAGGDGELLEAGSRSALGQLVQGLAGVLGWDDAKQQAWRHALAALLEPAAAGRWPRAARCLYELQKIPADLSRDVFAVDLVEPIRTLGRRPVKRPLPHARDVMLLLKLRTAHQQLVRSNLSTHAQHELDQLFEVEMHRLERDVRAKLEPIITNALTDSGFLPSNRVETVARDKIVAELLDRICERGYLRFGNLRDAVARNQLKLPDLRGPGEFVGGDPLLKADTRLAYDLDGIYRRGEFYLRALQRGSSLFFGTRSGRWLFLYLIAPFLAAFLTLTFAIELQHIGGRIQRFASKILAPRQVLRPASKTDTVAQHIVYTWDEGGHLVWHVHDEFEWDSDGRLVWVEPEPEYEWDDNGNLVFDPDEFVEVARSVVTSTAVTPAKEGEVHASAFPHWESVFVLGVFLLLMFHVPSFRRAFLSVVSGLFATLKSLLWDIPAKIIRSRIVVAIRYSAPVRFLGRYLVAPLLVAAFVVLFLSFLGAAQNRLLRWGGIVLGAAFLAFNTPWGWSVQERLSESISDGWRVFRVNLLPGLVATVLDWFRRLANWVERQLYEVDEWLRFRGGDSGSSLALKALLGLFWFPFAYFARFAFYLLIEPQVNPVKHFPVVTVSHKVILPLTPSLAESLNISTGMAFWLLAGVPGVFGFIAWELLSNWKLYAANRPARLKPVVIGSHGESMRGLLCPGFHSGAMPKLFRKLRRADLRHDHRAAVRLHHEVQHSAEGVKRFLARELIALLQQAPEWAGQTVRLEGTAFGCQRVMVSLAAPGLGHDPLAIAFENRGGRIAATIERAGWSDKLTHPQREALFAALRGLFDMAAVEQFDDRNRGPDAPNGTDLSRTWTWDDWTRRWGVRLVAP